MNAQKIVWLYVGFFVIFALSVFTAGIIETTRLESFNIGETLLLNVTNESSNVWADYEEFKSGYIFTNDPIVQVLNFFGMSGLLYLIFYSWNMGRRETPLSLHEIFTQYTLVLILIIYILGVIFEYLVDIFVNQLIVVLFNEIYSEVFMFKLLNEWFFGFILFCLFISWLANQLKYFDKITPF
jgi:hypothetical protein